jgi:hypothetical protein
MAKSLLLDTVAWDLVLDSSGNIALASDPYALAQNAACAIRLWLGELWYDTTQGIPYLQEIMGQPPSLPLLKAQFAAAALTVEGVVAAQVFISGFSGRQITGQVQVTDQSGQVSAASF